MAELDPLLNDDPLADVRTVLESRRATYQTAVERIDGVLANLSSNGHGALTKRPQRLARASRKASAGKMSAAARKAVSLRMKAYWRAKRAEAK